MIRISTVLSTASVLLFLKSAFGVEYEWQQFNHIQNITAITFNKDTAWIGTEIGLGKLNIPTGNFFLYDFANSGSRTGFVNNIAIDHNNVKWLATRNGIASFDGARWENFDTSNSILSSQNVTQVIVDSSNTKWFVCQQNLAVIDTARRYWGGGIACFDGDKWKLFDSTNSDLGTSKITKMANGINGLWFLTSKGLCHRNSEGAFEYFTVPKDITSTGLLSIQADSKGTIWVLCSQFGHVKDTLFLSGIDTAGNWTTINLTDSLPKGMRELFDFSIDAGGKFWFCDDIVGIVVWDQKTWQPYYYMNSELPKNLRIYSSAFDEKNRFWFSMPDDTLRIFENPSVKKIPLQASSLPVRGFTSMARDKKGVYWLGSSSGVIRMKDDTLTLFDTSNSDLIYNYGVIVAVDSMNRKWFGTNCGGMSMYNDTQWVSFVARDSTIPDNCVNDIAFQKDGLMWLAFYSGIASFDGSKFNYDTLGHISSVAVDPSGNVWAGGLRNGPYLLENSRWVSKAPTSEGLQSWGMRAGGDGSIWCSTDNGLYRYKENSWTHFDISSIGIPDRNDPLTVDKKGNVWEITNSGLALYDGTSWSLVGKSDWGFPQLWKLLLEEDDGSLWFQTAGGFAVRRIKGTTRGMTKARSGVFSKSGPQQLLYVGKPLQIPAHDKNIVEVRIMTVNGKVIRRINVNSSGRGVYFWDGRDINARPVGYGIYFAVLSKQKNSK